jgi:hypothetical protein
MSKFNSVRIINLNYNNNSMKIDDETFHFAGESTLMSLRNGGGKSVLVQIIMSLFIKNKRYRSTTDRDFSGYFSSAVPTYIMVEWQLDGGENYVLTGMMVRKKINSSDEDSRDDLEIVNFIHEYRDKGKYDISSIPLIEVTDGVRKVRGFVSTKQLFEKFKKDKSVNFNYYDMTSHPQTNSYFDRLCDYDINYKEWESIIRKLNLKESGLSELFTNSKNVAGLVEKWFLKVVEDKLNKEESKIKNFEKIVLKYIKQYKENKTKIDKKAAIDEFFIDADSIRLKAMNFCEAKDKTLDHENRIANLAAVIGATLEELGSHRNLAQESISTLKMEIDDILYSKMSLKAYNGIDEAVNIESEMNGISEKIQKEHETKELARFQISVMECAKLHKEYKDFSSEVQEIENMLEILSRKYKDYGMERNDLGYTLKEYYLAEKNTIEDTLSNIESNITNLNEKNMLLKSKLQELRAKQNGLNRVMGELSQKIKIFTDKEKEFNKLYDEDLMRNITGYYDSNALIMLDKKCRTYLGELIKAIEETRENIINNEELKKTKERDEKDKIEAKTRAASELENVRQKVLEYDNEILAVKDILKYIDFEETEVFNKHSIISEFDKRISRMNAENLIMQLEYEQKKDELRKLQTGKMVELGRELEQELDKRDISFVYGMEWLKKNSKTQKENERLITENPFIPYSIVMNSKELEKLNKEPIEKFTSYPIIILIKNELEAAISGKGDSEEIVRLGKVNFLISFNNKLINESELMKIVEQKKLENLHIEKKISEKTEEIKFYEEKRNRIAFSTLNKDKYFDAKNTETTLEKDVDNVDKELFVLRKSINELSDAIKSAQQVLKKNEINEKDMVRKLSAVSEFSKKYDEYVENKLKHETTLEELDTVISSIIDDENNEKANMNELKLEEDKRNSFLAKEKATDEKLSIYEVFKEGTIINKDIEDMEARYNSLTKKITDDQKNLETRLEVAKSRFVSKEKELIDRQTEYNIKDNDFKDVLYDNFKEKQLKQEIKAIESLILGLDKELNKLDKNKALIEQRINAIRKDILSKFGKSQLKPREELIEQNFDELIHEKEYEKAKLSEKIDDITEKIRQMENNRTSLAEYQHFEVLSPVETIIEYASLDKFRGELVRDYKISIEEKGEYRNRLAKEIEKVLRKDLFASDDFFKKPLSKMEELSSEPEYLLENLKVTLSAYSSLMEKLNADIELINKEKDNVLQAIFDYIFEIHENLAKIDKNSSISIRGRSIKMLRILLPDWEENKHSYRAKLDDLIERLTTSALERLDKNENIEDMISAEVTTKNLYNETISIGSIEIKLYKIEEEREYPISWDEVAKNSGGEGFLSAFVILSSLLSYMRRDETDIFADRESSKVLLMDNPFAQTSSEHLLKPLMEIAKKSNTQLICLSGLGGDSIFNRFDNIYVLNLISSKLLNGMRFIKGDHIKGNEPEVLVSSNFRIMEQMELF